MNSTKHAVAITLFASMQSGAKHYTKASVEKIRILLAKYHDVQIQRRWLFYCLEDLEGKGYIRRKKRYLRHWNGTFVQLSSMVTFTLSGVKYLTQKKITGAAQLLKRMLQFLAGKDKRWPAEEDIAAVLMPEELELQKRRLRALTENIG